MALSKNTTKTIFHFLVFTTFLLLNSCQNNENFGFIVAGHTYGKPGVDNIGFHPPFKAEMSKLSNDQSIDFGVLTGDIVISTNEVNWDEIDQDLAIFGKETFIVAGNHDLGNRSLFEKRYGRTYYSFYKMNNLFIALEVSGSGWSVIGKQLEFLKSVVNNLEPGTQNIFVFCHHLIWWDNSEDFKSITLNSKEGLVSPTNFKKTLKPLFEATKLPVYFISGDVGAHTDGTYYFYKQIDNFHYCASGMGGGKEDNYLNVQVNNGKVTIDPVMLGKQ